MVLLKTVIFLLWLCMYVGTWREGEIFRANLSTHKSYFVSMSITTFLNFYPTIPEKIQQQF